MIRQTFISPGLVYALGVVLATCVSAAELIVLNDGSSIWATSARLEAGQWVFVRDGGSGREHLSTDAVDTVIPAVVRGRNYSADEITKTLDVIEQVSRRRGKLRKQLNMLRGEWSELRKDTSSLEPEIDNLLDRFARNPGDTALFKEVKVALGMVQFKDMRGKYKDRIDAALNRMQHEYCATNMARLAIYTNIPTLSIVQFVAARRLADDLQSAQTAAMERAAITAMIDRCRTNAWNHNGRRAWDGFKKGKNLQSYLDSAGILLDLKKLVANDEQQENFIDDLIKKMRAELVHGNPDYSFEMKGVPLNRVDRDVLNRLRRRLTLITLSSMPIDEHSLIFPTTTPAGLPIRSVINVPVRVVFARTPPAERVYCLQAMILGDMNSSVIRRTDPLKLVLKDGHMDVTARFDFTTAESGFQPQRQEDGRVYVLVMLVYDDNPGRGDDASAWTAASVAFPIPVL